MGEKDSRLGSPPLQVGLHIIILFIYLYSIIFIKNKHFGVLGFWGFGEIGRAHV